MIVFANAQNSHKFQFLCSQNISIDLKLDLLLTIVSEQKSEQEHFKTKSSVISTVKRELLIIQANI